LKFNEDVISDSYIYCKKLATEHYENFPVGSFLIPAEKRKYVYAIYAFARTADDIADSNERSEKKLNDLNKLETDLYKILSNDKSESIDSENLKFLIALSDTITKLKIPVEEFLKLLKAFKQDSVKNSYNKFNELIEYSDNSANPIGHLILYLFGYNEIKDKELFGYSDKICTALQLTNFWQDVSRDLEINRVYIPEEEMNKFGYSMRELMENIQNDNFRSLIKYLTEQTRKMFNEGYKLIDLVNGRLKYELKFIYKGGNEILNKIEKINYNVLTERVKLSKWDYLKMLWQKKKI